MSWSPNPSVQINGTDFTGFTVGQVSFSRGRRTVYETPNAGFCSVELRDVSGIPAFEVGQTVQVEVQGNGSNRVKMFTGLLSDWVSRTVVAADGPVVVYRLQAVGPLARINRRQVFFTGRPSEDDGDRVRAAVASGLALAWEELPFDLTWGSVGSAVTWMDVTDASYDSALIDAGVYTLAALGSADGGYNALQVSQEAGFSGDGILFETAAGAIGYADANRRADIEEDGYLEVPVGALSVDGLGVSSSLADITNRVTVEFDGGAVQADDQFSIVRYGLFESALTTSLVSQSNAQARAEEFVSRRATPEPVLEELGFNLLGVDTALREPLLSIAVNDALQINNIPAQVGFTRFQGFVEGMTWTVSPFEARVTLTVSERNLSISALRWGQVDETLEWQAVGTAITWADARTL